MRSVDLQWPRNWQRPRCKGNCIELSKTAEAKARAEASLNKRVEQLGERKTELETQLRDLRKSVMKAERELDSSFRKLNPADEEKKAAGTRKALQACKHAASMQAA